MIAAIMLVILLALLGGAVLVWLRIRRDRGLFGGPRSRDDVLRCRDAREYAVTLRAGDIQLPGHEELCGQTVLIHIQVKSSFLGRIWDPFIEVGEGRGSYRQYFERGSEGMRYLNVSASFQDIAETPPSVLRLKGRRICWQASATLLACKPPSMSGARILVLAPHPDDAEIASFGLYSTHSSWVVTLTAGEMATGVLPAPSDDKHSWAARLRVADSLTAPRLGAVPPEQILNLVYPDGSLEDLYRNRALARRLACDPPLSRSSLRAENAVPEFKEAAAEATWAELKADLVRVLEWSRPTCIVCPHPRLDSHPDHVFTTVALAEALAEWPAEPLLLTYAVHVSNAPANPPGPPQSMVSLPPGIAASASCESIWSVPLDSKTRLAKFLAVEAMHGVRRLRDADASPSWRSVAGHITAWLIGDHHEATSLLRRSVRPNELFYRLSLSTLRGMLDGRQPGGHLSANSDQGMFDETPAPSSPAEHRHDQ